MKNLQKKSKTQLWLIMCELGIIKGDCSLYLMKRYTKNDMVEMIEAVQK